VIHETPGVNLKRAILLEYRRVHDASPAAPYLHARDGLAARLGVAYEALAAHVKELEQGRFLHWKAQDLYKLSPRGLRVTADPTELEREFPEE
jgi:predicted transcriptional regulator